MEHSSGNRSETRTLGLHRLLTTVTQKARRGSPSVLPVLLIIAPFLWGSPARGDKIDDYVKARMEKEHIPGLSLAVVNKGGVVKATGYGYANLELHVPATPNTAYQVGSVTKQFTAAAIMILVQENKVGLDQKISKYIPGTPETWKDITVRQLLTHTSGLQGDSPTTPKALFADYAQDEILKSSMDLPLLSPPGTKFSYSNLGFNLLAIIIEEASGKSYADFLRERIFQPLGMTATTVNDRYAVTPNRAQGLLWIDGRLRVCQPYSATRYMGSASILSTVVDLAKWDASLDTDKILTATSRNQMWTTAKLLDGAATGYGFGWYTSSLKKHSYIHHNGAMNGFEANISRFPDDKLTVIVLVNQSGLAATEKIATGVARSYVPSIRPTIQGKTPSFLKLDPSVYSAYAGRYEWWNNYMLTITPGVSGLLGQLPGGEADEYRPVSATSFWQPEDGVQLTIVKNPSGEVAGLRVRQDDGLERTIPRIGPLLHSLTRQPDSDPSRTQRVATALKAMGSGSKEVGEDPNIAPGRKKEFSSPNGAFVGLTSLTFIAAENVAGRGIERHNEKVSQILYYKLITDNATRNVLVYLTASDLVADTDVVED